jgi:formylglycine-generating enzyme required for sulfatase activity
MHYSVWQDIPPIANMGELLKFVPCIKNIILLCTILSANMVQPALAEQKFKGLARQKKFTDPLTGIEFVLIKGGCFQMGDSFGDGYTAEDGTSIEKPVHDVCISDFFMGKYEITVKQFRTFIAETGYKTESERNTGGLTGCFCLEFDKTPVTAYRSWANWKTPNKYLKTRDNHPVSCVSWNDTQVFISWLKSKTSVNYRLPTEAEWEYAARGGTKTRNYWGNGKTDACRYGNVADRTKVNGGRDWGDKHECDDGYPFVAPVGHFKPNDFGLHDMMGNVWEWTNDRFDGNFYQSSKTRDNPEGPKSGSSRIYRGGSWISGPNDVRAAFRPNLLPERRYYDVGFRLVFPAR